MNDRDLPSGRWARRSDGLEFERVSFFTDAVFAIAMTLLIVAVGVPALTDTTSSSDLQHALREHLPEYIAFFIGFAVLGNYWMANHRFVSHLQAIDGTYVAQTLLYLAFVAWLPFPTALLGSYDGNPVAVGLFALSAAMVSGCEALLLRRANRAGLFRRALPKSVYRHAMRASLLPVFSFVVSVPVAYANTTFAIVLWFVAIPAQVVLDRKKPTDFDAFFS